MSRQIYGTIALLFNRLLVDLQKRLTKSNSSIVDQEIDLSELLHCFPRLIPFGQINAHRMYGRILSDNNDKENYNKLFKTVFLKQWVMTRKWVPEPSHVGCENASYNYDLLARVTSCAFVYGT